MLFHMYFPSLGEMKESLLLFMAPAPYLLFVVAQGLLLYSVNFSMPKLFFNFGYLQAVLIGLLMAIFTHPLCFEISEKVALFMWLIIGHNFFTILIAIFFPRKIRSFKDVMFWVLVALASMIFIGGTITLINFIAFF